MLFVAKIPFLLVRNEKTFRPEHEPLVNMNDSLGLCWSLMLLGVTGPGRQHLEYNSVISGRTGLRDDQDRTKKLIGNTLYL